jgi:hypothetical protein
LLLRITDQQERNMSSLTAIILGQALLLGTASAPPADGAGSGELILLAQNVPPPQKPEPQKAERQKAAPPAADRPGGGEPVKGKARPSARRRDGNAIPPGGEVRAPESNTRTTPRQVADVAETGTKEKDLPSVPAQENTGAGTYTRGATGADQPMNNVDPPSRNNRPVRRSDERATSGAEGASGARGRRSR